MPEPLCGRARRTEKDYIEKDASKFPGPWRRWCGCCVTALERRDDLPDDPDAVTATVVKRTGNGSETGTGNVLHVPAAAVEERSMVADGGPEVDDAV